MFDVVVAIVLLLLNTQRARMLRAIASFSEHSPKLDMQQSFDAHHVRDGKILSQVHCLAHVHVHAKFLSINSVAF